MSAPHRFIPPLVLMATLAAPMPVLAQDEPDYPAIRRIVSARCKFCHSAIPMEDGLNAGSQPAKGVKFDTPADVQKFAALMLEQAVKTQRMPPDNATHMTEAERATLGRWIAAGAKVP
ncbi:MAG: hypothetical protein J0I80_05090 [Sphingomonas sp.]|nr:hypothetical protein [Sphingomonas sp.]